MTRDEERAIEWDCQKVMRQYYHYVDHHEFDEAVGLFTEDVTRKVMGLDLKGRDEILEALHGGLGNDTIRHVLTNVIVTVIDKDNTELWNYTTNYYSREGRREDMDGPLPFDGPHRLGDMFAKLRRVGDEWKIAARERGYHVFRRTDGPVALENWARNEGKLPPGV